MSTKEHDFYVTLPSDTSLDAFPNNTASEYMTKLSRRIELSGEWEVALRTISYVKWNTIKLGGEPVHYVVNGTKKAGSSLKNYYTTVRQYVADVNASIPKEDKEKIVFSVRSGKVTITLESGYEVHLRKEQAIILGFLTFGDSDIVEKITVTETGSHKANLHRETSIYVYCDIIQPQIVGNKNVPLLDIIWDEGKGKCETMHSNENLHYVPLRTKSFEEVKVLLRSSTDERISFEHGHTLVTLKGKKITFRMSQQGYGLGGIFRSAGPVFRDIGREAGKIGAVVGADLAKGLLTDVIDGKTIKESALERGKQAGKQSLNLTGERVKHAIQPPKATPKATPKVTPKTVKRPRLPSIGPPKTQPKKKKKKAKKTQKGGLLAAYAVKKAVESIEKNERKKKKRKGKKRQKDDPWDIFG